MQIRREVRARMTRPSVGLPIPSTDLTPVGLEERRRGNDAGIVEQPSTSASLASTVRRTAFSSRSCVAASIGKPRSETTNSASSAVGVAGGSDSGSAVFSTDLTASPWKP